MASKGQRSKLDHEPRAKRQKALEVPREPCRSKTHWDHVLEEMVWLSKDFESERKWKLAQAKKVALRASRGMVDQATRGERRLKEEEQRMKKVALNISKDVKKFWMKIEKLVLYKHQMELDEKKKKALDKQLEFLLGQTERYSTMLAENLTDTSKPIQQDKSSIQCSMVDKNKANESTELDVEIELDTADIDGDFNTEIELDTADVDGDFNMDSEDEVEDEEHTIEEDEALITAEERQEELEALKNEVDLPLEELLKRYAVDRESREVSLEKSTSVTEKTLVVENHSNGNDNDLDAACNSETNDLHAVAVRGSIESNCGVSLLENHLSKFEISETGNMSEVSAELTKEHASYDFSDAQEDDDFVLGALEEKDDETTLSEEEELAKADPNNPMDEIALLQRECEIPVEELLARYNKDSSNHEETDDESEYASALSENSMGSPPQKGGELEHQDVGTDADIGSEDFEALSHSPTKVQEGSLTKLEENDGDNRIEDAAAAARSAQPTGNTFSTTKVRTKFPFLLKHSLREYQHIGLDWLVTMYEKRLNGILADEMGLGKTIMTISLLAHLACEKGIWGPHLIVVPTSVMLNWETEFLKWCPAFKILTYFGSAKERKFKRQGWMKPNSFHICITTYRLVIQDSKIFKRKKWKYLILDEAHLIKNWKSQRWQTLLNFNSKRRILLTGTPLQNDLMELWSLMHFLMPHIFQSHQEFKDWFCNPISGMVDGQEKVNKEVVDRLHNVLRPFILRRLKRDVEKQLPMKHEHVIYCRLSRRQRNLYEDFIASSETQATLATSNFFGMISVIMQLRKVCNHPDLFEGRPIVSSFDMSGIDTQLSSSICSILTPGPFSTVNFNGLGLLFTHLDFSMTSWESDEVKAIATPASLIKARADLDNLEDIRPGFKCQKRLQGINIFQEIQRAIMEERMRRAKQRVEAIAWWNSLMCEKRPMYSTSLRELVTIRHPVYDIHSQKSNPLSYLYSSKLAEAVLSPVERFQRMIELVEGFMFAIPAARAPQPIWWCSSSGSNIFLSPSYKQNCSQLISPLLTPFRPAIVRRQVYFPDRRLIQFDCGKLQELALLLRRLKSEGHRALIFTQMTKMLDILEAFINLYGYTYMRLDGSTQPEERQTLMQRFNTNPKYFLFILSTRSGGVGINLVGADTVIFYDSDWNPAMDQQAQDRCHRIGQTREVHIYRLISESTIEENILKKANQKRALDDLVIQSGSYNTEFFTKLDPMELFSGHRTLSIKNMQKEKSHSSENEVSVSNADVEAALQQAEDEADLMALKRVEQEEAVDKQEFTEEALGRMEEDEFLNEDDMKVDEPGNLGGSVVTPSKDNGETQNINNPHKQKVLTIVSKEDDVDMLADVKEMAAAVAAAGQAISSFENQLRPIDRYAVRFLEMWDPIIDKVAMESQVRFEETEWELDRIERYKEEMEAEVDEDEEPLVYERWDADFATEAYRQQVEALTQLQLMEDLECEAKEKEDAEDENCDSAKHEMHTESKPKSKKKPKKAKFKSLKKGSLAFEPKPVKEELSNGLLDEDTDCDGAYESSSPPISMQKKRKKPEFSPDGKEEKALKKKSKKLKKNGSEVCPTGLDFNLSEEFIESKSCEIVDNDKPGGRSRTRGKISITSMPVKRVLMIKPEKLKKGNIWSRDCVPSPDSWLPQEDAILCAMVHEYGPQWSFVCETLYRMSAGGLYRGRYRHPVHCCERYRELIQRYVLSAPNQNPNNEKTTNAGSGKALLKVTEDNIRMLLDIAAEQPDREFLIQKHFTALLLSVWKSKSCADHRQNPSVSRNGIYFGGGFFTTSGKQTFQNATTKSKERMTFSNSDEKSKLLAAALHDAETVVQDERVSGSNHGGYAPMAAEQLELTLDFQIDHDDDDMVLLPSSLTLSLLELDHSPCKYKHTSDEHLKMSQATAENRFRAAARACDKDSLAWASSVFPTNDLQAQSGSKSQSFGKHKLSIPDSTKPAKSKLRKTAMDQIETPRHFSIPALSKMTAALHMDLNLISQDSLRDVGVDNSSFFDHAYLTDDTTTGFPYGINKDLELETEGQQMVPDQYMPGVISGLDDCSIQPEFTDIG